MMKVKYVLLSLSLLVTNWVISQNLNGNWYGLVDIQGQKFRVQYVLAENPDGWNASFISPDQSAQEYPCDKVTITPDSVILTLSQMQITYRGKRSQGDSVIEGNVYQGENVTLLLLTKTEVRKPVLFRAQNPIEPFPYKTEEVTFLNVEAGIYLSGTLTIPEGKGPFPAVILISGSGPQDRDESMLDHKPFWVLADHLSRNGFAVLRYDDRGVGESRGNFYTANSRDFAGDALAALAFLESKTFIDKNKTGFAGHSEGGYIAPMAAVMSSSVDFIISLAGSGVSGKDILHKQTIEVEKMEGLSPEQAEKDAKKNDDIFEILRNNPDSATAASAIFAYLENSQAASLATIPNFEEYKKYHNSFFNSRWLRFFAEHNPAEDWAKVKCPVLALNGDRDLQVDADINLNAIANALDAGGNTNFKTIKYVGLNHLFQPTETGRVSEYENIETTIDPEVLADITSWLKGIL